MSQQWKQFEREVAGILGGRRKVRSDFGESTFDVDVPDFPELSVDAKRHVRFAHHNLLTVVQQKYCQELGRVPLLCTRQNGKRLLVASLPLHQFADYLNTIRALREEVAALKARLEIRETAEAL